MVKLSNSQKAVIYLIGILAGFFMYELNQRRVIQINVMTHHDRKIEKSCFITQILQSFQILLLILLNNATYRQNLCHSIEDFAESLRLEFLLSFEVFVP